MAPDLAASFGAEGLAPSVIDPAEGEDDDDDDQDEEPKRHCGLFLRCVGIAEQSSDQRGIRNFGRRRPESRQLE